MQKSIHPKCLNGHDAQMLCGKKSCQYPSPICKYIQCQYSTKHQRCSSLTNLKHTQLLFTEWQHFFLTQTQQPINNLDIAIKQLEIGKQKLLDIITNPTISLNKSQLNLFRLLNEGPASDIKPYTVSQVIEGFQNNAEKKQRIQQLKNQTQDITTKLVETIKSSILQIEKVYGFSGKAEQIVQAQKGPISEDNQIEECIQRNFQFDPSICHEGFQFQHRGKTITNKNLQRFGLINPALSRKNILSLEIQSEKGNIWLGIAHQKQLINSKYNWPQSDKGIYIINGQCGLMYHALDPKQDLKQTQFRFQKGDKITMVFDSQSSVLQLENMTKQTSHRISNIVQQQNNPLHFCVVLTDQDDKVSIFEFVQKASAIKDRKPQKPMKSSKK